jgi:hypothetical protein
MPYKDPEKAKENKRKYHLKNKKKHNAYNKKYYKENKKMFQKKCKEYYKKNAKKLKQKAKEYRKKNHEKIKAYDRFRFIRDRDKRIKISKKYYIKNRKNLIKKAVKYVTNRLKKDPSFRLIRNLRRRTLYALKGRDKSDKTMNLLGVTNIEIVWQHLEKSFKPGMTRKNHGKWHVDHILPCASFDLSKPEEQIKCFHYTNLQALWAHENLSKGNRIL